MLSNRVCKFTNEANRWEGMTISCHNATHFWLLWDLLGRRPTLDEYATACGQYAKNLKAMIRKGKRLGSAEELAALPPGTVLIFSGDGTEGDHSCVLKAGGFIGGYNQAGWFLGGIASTYTQHPRTEIVWLDAGFRRKVRGDGGHPRCVLYAVPEEKAERVLYKVLNDL